MNQKLGLPLRQEFLRVVRGSTGLYLFGTAMGFLVGIQLARGLGVENYGIYGSAMAAASLGATVTAGGLQLHATREIAALNARGEHDAAARLVVWSFRMLLKIGSIAAMVVGGYVFWGQSATPVLAAAAMVLTLLMAVLWLMGAIVRGTGAIVLGQAMDVAIRPSAHSALLLASMLAMGAIGPGLALTLSSVAILVALPFGWLGAANIWKAVFSGSAASIERRAWHRASATMSLTTIIHSATAAVPLIMIGVLSNAEQAGLFRVAAAVMLLPSMPSTMITVLIPAMISSLYERREIDRLRLLAMASGIIILLPTVLIVGALWIYGVALLRFAFGEDYAAAGLPVSILAGSMIVNALSGISFSLLNSARHDSVVTKAFGLSLLVMTVGVALLAAPYGASGVAIAVLIGISVRTLYLVIATWRLMGVDPSFFSILGWLSSRIKE